ncbi:MAG: hypothetical protein N2318_03270 [Meiothermus sp.]|nr:hypothetical protein [Meiothermus sp.]
MELPANLPDELRVKLEALSKTSPSLAQTILRAWQAREGRPNPAAAESLAQPAPTPTPPPAPSPVSTPPTPSPDWREVRAFEWQDLLKKAEETLRSEGDWERLGPLVRLLVAQALRHGARNDPSREAHVFLAQWEVCQFLGISTRTLERWLGDPRYAPYREVAQDWIAWETWMASGEAIKSKAPIKGGTLWRVRVRPLRRSPKRKIRVLAPYLRLPWRDLAQDIQQGHTERQVCEPDTMSGYKEYLQLGKGVTLRVVVGRPFATPQQLNLPFSLYPDIARDLRTLLRAASIPPGRKGRLRWAQAVAAAIAQALGDQKSLRYWLKVAFQALKVLVFGGGEAAMRLLFRVISIAREAREDGFARSPGAYAQHLLRREGWHELVGPYAHLRVGEAA